MSQELSPTVDFLIHAADTHDAAVLRHIRLAALRTAPEAFGTQESEVRVQPLQYFIDLIRRGNYFLAFNQNEVIGMSSYGTYVIAGQRCAGLYGLFVQPTFRGHGVAEALVRSVEKMTRNAGYNSLYLDVNPAMTAALRLYERLGFVDTGTYRAMDREPLISLMQMKKTIDLNHHV